MSHEYVASLVLVLGSILKLLGYELPSAELETIVGGVLALWIAYRRFSKGDINLVGAKV